MSKKKTYEATSPIKRNGKHYGVGDTLKLTEEQAEGLHVKPASGGAAKKTESAGDEFDPSKGSHENNADDSIAYIGEYAEEDLEGFVDPEKEERVTVLRAWDERFGTDLAGN